MMRDISPAPKVVIVTMFEEPRYMRDLMELGASAYLLKSITVEHLTEAVRAAVLDPEGQNVVVGMPRAMAELARDGTGGVLSVREMEILVLVARGLSNRQIASLLTVSEGTVKRHLANAYPKMGVTSSRGAVRKALFEGRPFSRIGSPSKTLRNRMRSKKKNTTTGDRPKPSSRTPIRDLAC